MAGTHRQAGRWRVGKPALAVAFDLDLAYGPLSDGDGRSASRTSSHRPRPARGYRNRLSSLSERASTAGIHGRVNRVWDEPGQDGARPLRVEGQPRQRSRAGGGGLHQRHRLSTRSVSKLPSDQKGCKELMVAGKPSQSGWLQRNSTSACLRCRCEQADDRSAAWRATLWHRAVCAMPHARAEDRRIREFPQLAGRRFIRSPTCCCTTWGKDLPTDVGLSGWRERMACAASGESACPDGQRREWFYAWWPCAQFYRGDYVARRRS